MAPTQYKYLAQGQGGEFELPSSDIPALSSIGTHGCRTCVCVYIPLSTTKCFAAHISAHVVLPRHTKDAKETDWVPTPTQGASLKNFTMTKLAEALPQYAQGQYKENDLREHAITICPHRQIFITDGITLPATGSYIIQAINQFFLLDGQGTDNVTGHAHGFVANHVSHGMDYIPFNGADLVGYDRYRRLLKRPSVTITPIEQEELAKLHPLVGEVAVGTCGYEDKNSEITPQWSFWIKDGEWEVVSPESCAVG